MLHFLAGVAAGAAAGVAGAAWLLDSRQKRLGRFFSFAAHEINTPITAVNMTVSNLLAGVFGPVPAEQLPWVEMMREQVGRLNGLVGELRDLIHLELHKDIHLQHEEVSPQELLEASRRAIAFGCASSKIALEAEVPLDLPSVRCDRDRAARTLTSALFHARKFRTSGPIGLSARAGERGVVFEVSYDGPPLTAEDAERSLNLYFPAAARDDQRMSATGLGLGVSRAVARLQGGDLRLSASGSRTVVALELPRNSGATNGS